MNMRLVYAEDLLKMIEETFGKDSDIYSAFLCAIEADMFPSDLIESLDPETRKKLTDIVVSWLFNEKE